MWIVDLRTVTFSSAAVLRLSRPDALARAAVAALREASVLAPSSDPESFWTEYEARRAVARWTDQRELSLDRFLEDATGLGPPERLALESAIADRLASSLEWQPDALPTLDYLKESGYPTALLLDLPVPLSSAWRERAQGWVDAMVSSRELGLRTPAAAVFSEAVRRLHGVPARTLHVGEGLAEDVHGAQRAGLRAALLERPLRRPPDPGGMEWLHREVRGASEGVRPDLKLRGLEELAAAIESFA